MRRICTENEELLILAVGAVIGGVLFGGVHCLAWNFYFPSQVEATVWRICSVVITSLPLLSIMPFNLLMRLNPDEISPEQNVRVEQERKWGWVLRRILGSILVFGFVVPYVLARLFLLFETFRTLFSLPSDVFVETWSGSYPHWG